MINHEMQKHLPPEREKSPAAAENWRKVKPNKLKPKWCVAVKEGE